MWSSTALSTHSPPPLCVNFRVHDDGRRPMWVELAKEVLQEEPCRCGGIRSAALWHERGRACASLPEAYATERLKVIDRLQGRGIDVDISAYVSLLRCCGNAGALSEGRLVHAHIVNNGHGGNRFLENHLVEMYGKCGAVEEARAVFDKILQRNVFSWSIMIVAYNRNGRNKRALELFGQMQRQGFKPGAVICVSILDACGCPEALAEGKTIHACIIASGFKSDVIIETALLSMYGKCGRVVDAKRVFDKMRCLDVISWTAMIAAFAQNGYGKDACELYWRMQQEGLKPNNVTFVSILDACDSPAALTEGKVIHSGIIAAGFESDVVVGTALLNMYGKCGSVENAKAVFDKMLERDVVSWNAMIAAYVQNGRGREALELFQRMQHEGMKPNSLTFVSVLDACASLAALTEGKLIHSTVVASGYELDGIVGNSVINMYGKCGSPHNSRSVFDKMHRPDVVSWNVIIAALGQNGHAEDALKLFRKMLQERVKPDGITFVSILSACSHSGLVDEGRHYFLSMSKDHGITPTAEHYKCVIDLLGRSGLLDEAEDMINNMPFQPDAVAWGTLLGACQIHCDLDRGARAAEHLFELDPHNAIPYVSLANIYAAAGRWDDVEKVRKAMVNRGVKKHPGYSWVEVKGTVHEFSVGDKYHPWHEEIYAELQKLNRRMKEMGYVPDTKGVLRDMGEVEKVELLNTHSEMLAIAFGLIAIPDGMPLHIIKNLRVCSDCHTATKLISKISGRKITVRDMNRFHHFEHGVCSCRDYW